MPETGNNIKIEASINLIDETFDVSQSDNCHLSIQAEENGLSFCVFNPVINKQIILRHYDFYAKDNDSLTELCRNVYENDDLLKLRYKTSSHLLVSHRCTLMPQHLWHQANARNYLYFNHGWNIGEDILNNHLSSAELYNVFPYPHDLLIKLKQVYPGIALFHHATPLISSAVSQSLSSTKHQVTIYYYNGYLDIVVAKSGKLIFYNTFPISAPEDSIYYILRVLNSFNIDAATTTIAYSGDLSIVTPVATVIRKYVADLKECTPLDSVIYSHYLTDQLKARFVHLFNLHTCVS